MGYGITDLGITSDISPLISCSILIFMSYLILISLIAKNLALQRYNVIERNVIESNVGTVNYSSKSFHSVQQMIYYCFSPKFKILHCAPVNLLLHPRVP